MPDYWVNNLVCPVRFTDAMHSLASLLNIKEAMFDNHFLEIGPHSTLKLAIKEALPNGWNVEKCYSSVLSRQQPEILTSLTMVGRLHCLGYPIDIAAVNNPSLTLKWEQKILADLPPYPFDHSRQYWLESRTSTNYRFRGFPHNDFLGTPTPDWNPLEAQWNNRIILEEKAFFKDHKVSSMSVIKAPGFSIC
jgi:acyl transferase domain-containing protein